MCSIADLKPECSSCSAKISKCGVLQKWKCKCHPDKLCLLAFNAILKGNSESEISITESVSNSEVTLSSKVS